MIKSNVAKFLLIISLLLIIVFTFNNLKIFAVSTSGDPIENPDFFRPNTISTSGSDSKVITRVGNILGVINIIGVVVSVITLMIIGIKYMLGSVEEKAEYKQTAMTYIIGAILIFSITTIPNVLYQIGTGITSSI